ncbi:MAG: TraR/DksA family transcriptional regulator [Planctomycetota bacterium]
MKSTKQREEIEERLNDLEKKLVGEVRKHLENVQNTSASNPSELLDMVSEGEIDYMAAVSAQADSVALEEIQHALEKLEDGTYGVCDDCGEEIAERRLEVRPFAARCVACKEQQERNGMGRTAQTVSSRGSNDVYVDLGSEDRERPESSASEVFRQVEDVEMSEMF